MGVVSCERDPTPAESNGRPDHWTGIAALEHQLGDEAPTGRGIAIGHVESSGDNTNVQYSPHIGSGFFDSVSFTRASGPSKTSGHADATARLIYGPAGLAPGVQRVRLYQDVIDESNDPNVHLPQGWLQQCLRVRRLQYVDEEGNDAIRLLTESQPPDPQGCDLFTHSWIRGGSIDCEQVLTRVDYLIDEHDVIVIAGVNNQGNSLVPPLLASSFNAIAVGSGGRRSSTGYTQPPAAAPGRCKPDIVGRMSQTSYNTPIVTAVVARLLEAARRSPHEHARRAEVIKAVLLTGADKSVGFEPEPGRPLDPHHGAGSVRLDTSYRILDTPPYSPAALQDMTATPMRGWSFETIANRTVTTYPITIDQPQSELCVTITWHRRVEIHSSQSALRHPVTGDLVLHPYTNKPIYTDTFRTANLNLALLRPAGDDVDILAKSVSRVDNVEHIYLKDIPVGRYLINVSRQDRHDEDWTYAIAWRMRPIEALD